MQVPQGGPAGGGAERKSCAVVSCRSGRPFDWVRLRPPTGLLRASKLDSGRLRLGGGHEYHSNRAQCIVHSAYCTEVDIKSPGNAKKRVHGRAEPYFSQKLSLLCIFACALHTNLLTVRMHTFVAI